MHINNLLFNQPVTLFDHKTLMCTFKLTADHDTTAKANSEDSATFLVIWTARIKSQDILDFENTGKSAAKVQAGMTANLYEVHLKFFKRWLAHIPRSKTTQLIMIPNTASLQFVSPARLCIRCVGTLPPCGHSAVVQPSEVKSLTGCLSLS